MCPSARCRLSPNRAPCSAPAQLRFSNALYRVRGVVARLPACPRTVSVSGARRRWITPPLCGGFLWMEYSVASDTRSIDRSHVKAYLVGGGIASLASAAYLIRDGGLLGENICVFEETPILGGASRSRWPSPRPSARAIPPRGARGRAPDVAPRRRWRVGAGASSRARSDFPQGEPRPRASHRRRRLSSLTHRWCFACHDTGVASRRGRRAARRRRDRHGRICTWRAAQIARLTLTIRFR